MDHPELDGRSNQEVFEKLMAAEADRKIAERLQAEDAADERTMQVATWESMEKDRRAEWEAKASATAKKREESREAKEEAKVPASGCRGAKEGSSLASTSDGGVVQTAKDSPHITDKKNQAAEATRASSRD